VNVTARVI